MKMDITGLLLLKLVTVKLKYIIKTQGYSGSLINIRIQSVLSNIETKSIARKKYPSDQPKHYKMLSPFFPFACQLSWLFLFRTNIRPDFQTEKCSYPSLLGLFIGQQAQFHLLVQ